MLSEEETKVPEETNGLSKSELTDTNTRTIRLYCFVCYSTIKPGLESKSEEENLSSESENDGSSNDNDEFLCGSKLSPKPGSRAKVKMKTTSKELFQVLCLYMKLSWDQSYDEEQGQDISTCIPFCQSCEAYLTDLLEYHKHLERLVTLTKQITATVAMKIVESYSKAQNLGESSSYTKRPYENDKVELEVDLEAPKIKQCLIRINKLRQFIYERYNVKVKLSGRNSDNDTKSDSEFNEKDECKNYKALDVSVHCGTASSCSSPTPSPAREAKNIVSNEDEDVKRKGPVLIASQVPRTRSSKRASRAVKVKTTSYLSNHNNLLPQITNIRKPVRTRALKNPEVTLSRHKIDTNIDNPGSGNYDPNKSPDGRSSSVGGKNVVVSKRKLEKKYREVSPNKFLYAEKFPFEKADELFRCGSCDFVYDSSKSKKVSPIINHVREKHYMKKTSRPYYKSMKMVVVGPNKFLYGGKCIIEKVDDVYKCGTCDYSSEIRKLACRHVRLQHYLTEKTKACQFCGKLFQTSDKLALHESRHTEERPYICEICGKCFKIPVALSQHKRIHTDEADKNKQCEICGKKFAFSQVLKKHLVTHTGERKYECDICHAKFGEASTLRTHRRTHQGLKLYSCELCGIKFSQSGSVHRHIRSVHKKIPRSDTKKMETNQCHGEIAL